MVDEPSQPCVLALRVRSTVVITMVLWASTFGALAIVCYGSGATTGTALGTLLVAVGLIATVRTWRAVLLADEHGITIRNTWTTKSWAWDEIGEVGWEPTALARGLMVAISVCPFGDPYTHLATATGTGLGQLRQVVVPLRPLLKHHGVSDAMDRETATVLQWSDDPRSRHGTRAGDRNATR